MSSKRLINTVERCVDENLEGLVVANPGLRLLKGCPRVVIRADIGDVLARGHVTILTGGGSGHEPGHPGFCGKGMATAVVAGPIFTSPPSNDILRALRAVGKNNKAGVLVTFNNYTGDRLTFGLAMERASAEGIKLKAFINADDCALIKLGKTAGRRGLVGGILAIKVAGAMAEQGRSLEDIIETLELVAEKMGTIGLCLAPCSAPGQPFFFHLDQDEMTLGLGLHGEAGVQTVKITTAEKAIELMLDHMMDPMNPRSFNASKGDHVVCLLNNLGSLTFTEMNILTREIFLYLGKRGITMERFYSGHFMTSQEMVGFSITLLHVTDLLLPYLDYPTTAPGWKHSSSNSTHTFLPPHLDCDISNPVSNEKELDDVRLVSSGTRSVIYRALRKCCETMIENEVYLDMLDSESGDGDCGNTFKCAAKAILCQLGEENGPGLPVDCPYKLTHALAEIFENDVGGSSGGLYGIFFTSASAALKTSSTPESWHNALKAGTEAVMRHGGAAPGYRTMVDALLPAVEASAISLDKNSIEGMAKAAREGAQATVEMNAQAGRASYVESSRLKKPDPGAMAVALCFEVIRDIILENKS